MKKTYEGSCHCGKVRFEADIDLSAGTGKCNCSICTKTRSWAVILQPHAFRLFADDADLIDYQFGSTACTICFASTAGCDPSCAGTSRKLAAISTRYNSAASMDLQALSAQERLH
jgi:hypothetical protein